MLGLFAEAQFKLDDMVGALCHDPTKGDQAEDGILLLDKTKINQPILNSEKFAGYLAALVARAHAILKASETGPKPTSGRARFTVGILDLAAEGVWLLVPCVDAAVLICFVVVEAMVRGLLCLHANAGALAKELSQTSKLRICCRVCFIRGMVASYIVFLLAGPVTRWMRAPGAVEW